MKLSIKEFEGRCDECFKEMKKSEVSLLSPDEIFICNSCLTFLSKQVPIK